MSHCWSAFNFLQHMTMICYLYIFFDEVPRFFFFCPFLNLDFFLLMSCKYSWHILNTSPFIKYEFCNYFLPACVLYFLLTVSFPKQILISRRADLSSISFMDCAFGIVPKNSSPYPTSLRFYVIFHKFYSFVFYIYMKF